MSILQSISPTVHRLGGLPVNRLLAAPDRKMVGPFIFMEHSGPITVPRRPGAGVPEHPHAGLATFTYLMAGAMNHRDSAGHVATIRAGDIALMTSGRGITHEEMANQDEPATTDRVHFCQMWIALPDRDEQCEPAFELHSQSALPVFRGDRALARIAMGRAWGLQAPTTCHSTTLFADLVLEAGATLPLDAAEDELALIILEGEGDIGGTRLAPKSLHVLAPRTMALHSPTGCRAILLGGGHFASPRWIGGSFLASSPDLLRHWMRESTTARWPRIAG